MYKLLSLNVNYVLLFLLVISVSTDQFHVFMIILKVIVFWWSRAAISKISIILVFLGGANSSFEKIYWKMFIYFELHDMFYMHFQLVTDINLSLKLNTIRFNSFLLRETVGFLR